MVISHGPSRWAPLHALDGLHPPRITPAMGLAIGVSLAVHVAAGIYVYNNRFKPLETPADPPDDAIVLDSMVKWAAPEQTQPEPPPAMKVHRAPVPAEAPPERYLPVDPPPADVPLQTSPLASPESLGSGSGGVTVEVPAEPTAKIIGKPDWVSRPTGAQLARYYPTRAVSLGKSGQATLSCLVNATGTVRDCAVLTETPAGFGFGAAAVKLSQYFRMQPRTEDGQPVDGGRVSIPIRFQIE